MGFFEQMELPLGQSAPNFNLEKAVCNHGFFMMAPNHWIPYAKTLERPLRLTDSTMSVTASISHPTGSSSLSIHLQSTDDRQLSSSDRHAVLGQVSRMLRISEKDAKDVSNFHKSHLQAKDMNFGRIFRSPTLFEDIIKSILLCNCTWSRTLKMCEALCKLQWQHVQGLSTNMNRNQHDSVTAEKRKRGSKNDIKFSLYYDTMLDDDGPLGNFPNSKELVNFDENVLRINCNLGYRANYILEFAKEVENGTIDLEMLERDSGAGGSSSDEAYKALMKMKGLGPFACASILMCAGSYEKVPADSETINLLKEIHGRPRSRKATMQRDLGDIYGKYSPFQCLAYWFDLICLYEAKFGKLSEMKSTGYHSVTSSFHSKVSNSKGRLVEHYPVLKSKRRFNVSDKRK